MTYCEAVKKMDPESPHVHYHNQQYGFPIHNDNELFGRLILEINQAGLSWTTILKKEENFRKAYSNFEIAKVASYGEKEIDRLLDDEGIIRNKLKVNAAIHNAIQIVALQKENGSFEKWLDQFIGSSKEEWIKIFKKQFKFTGGEITNEFLMSTSYLKGAHDEKCAIFNKIEQHSPKWKMAVLK